MREEDGCKTEMRYGGNMTPLEIFYKFQIECDDMVRDMRSCHHNYHADNAINPHHVNPFHGEDDVWAHTCMVFNEALRNNMPHEVQIATIFHDLGKIVARENNEEKKKTRFFNHEGLSVYMALECINRMQLDISDSALIDILSIIALHGDFFDLLADSNTVRIVKKLRERFIDTPVLGRFVLDHLLCDHYGRICNHDDNVAATVKSVADESIINYKPKLKEYDKKIVLMVGPPGSGKSTWISQNGLFRGDAVLNRDDILMEVAADQNGSGLTYKESWDVVDQKMVDRVLNFRFATAKENRNDIYIDTTNMSRKSRRKWLSQVPKDYGKEAVVFMTDYATLFERNKTRERGPLPEFVLINMMKNFMPPLFDECDEVKWVFN